MRCQGELQVAPLESVWSYELVEHEPSVRLQGEPELVEQVFKFGDMVQRHIRQNQVEGIRLQCQRIRIASFVPKAAPTLPTASARATSTACGEMSTQ